ncbi:hypothetical protein AB1Y20_013821 [Prymnesium parvum]|uniref:Uncharacterized protein n=1 Tax=Prymnesium parvum TaxID=97485 RepID=A0AB34IGL0_PRYPA
MAAFSLWRRLPALLPLLLSLLRVEALAPPPWRTTLPPGPPLPLPRPPTAVPFDWRPPLAAAAILSACALPAHAAHVADGLPPLLLAASADLNLDEVLQKAARRALGGGLSGAAAGVLQVLSLMWLRTTMNYQYRFGTSTGEALRTLYAQGGVPRLYQGLPYALLQTPLSRFGDTAANSGVLALLAAVDSPLPMAARTALASAAAATWRIGLTPLDTIKTTLQVTGGDGYEQLKGKIQADGPTVLYQGALGNAAASFVGNYPWYLTFNTLNEVLPLAPQDELLLKLCRSALLGLCAASVSDTISNGIRVLKTTRQTSSTTITYKEALQQVLERDGWRGLLFRGLQTRLIANGLQAATFTVIWKYLEEQLGKAGFF